MKHLVAFAFVAAALAMPTPALASTWEIDPNHSSAHFSVKHMMVTNVRGEFSKVSGTLQLDEKDPARSSVEATIDATSVDTRNERRDGHLKSPDFFDVARYPTLTFKSRKVVRAPGGFKVTGDLTLHGVTKEVVLDLEGDAQVAKDPWGNAKIGGTATTRINRKDFGLTWNKALETGGVLVGEDVAVSIDLEFLKKADQAAH